MNRQPNTPGQDREASEQTAPTQRTAPTETREPTEPGVPGWVGRHVRIMRLNEAGEVFVWTTVILEDDDHTIRCDDKELLECWRRDGILGRASAGVLFPRDGRRFLNELPFAYKSPYCFAEPASG